MNIFCMGAGLVIFAAGLAVTVANYIDEREEEKHRDALKIERLRDEIADLKRGLILRPLATDKQGIKLQGDE